MLCKTSKVSNNGPIWITTRRDLRVPLTQTTSTTSSVSFAASAKLVYPSTSCHSSPIECAFLVSVSPMSSMTLPASSTSFTPSFCSRDWSLFANRRWMCNMR